MTYAIHLKRFSVHDVARMLEVGIVQEDDRVELIDGELRAMSPIGPLHAAIVKKLNVLLQLQLGHQVIISVQDPIRLDDFSEPEPDLAILHYRDDFYRAGTPIADDVLIVIEVSDSTLEYDRKEKMPRYATAGIGELWIINVADQIIEQYTTPSQGRYLNLHIVEFGDTLVAKTVDDLSLPLDQLF